MFISFCFVFSFLGFGFDFGFGGLMWCGGVVLVSYLLGCWFGGMIGRIRLVGGRVMREGEERPGRGSCLRR